MKALVLALCALLGLATGGGGPARAEPLMVPSGPAVLPLSGLRIELPAKKGRTYAVSGSWRIADAGQSFDARDVIDEHRGDELVAGTWVMVGWFTAGGCPAVLRQGAIDAPWEEAQAKLWGATFAARGGVFSFEGALGRQPVVMLCAERDARKSLLLYHFFIGRPETMTSAEMLRALRAEPIPARAFRAWTKDASVPVASLRRAEVRDRNEAGTTLPKVFELANTGLSVIVPDDGFVWLPHRGPDGVDQLDRLAPALPEVTLELARVEGQVTCEDAFELLANPLPSPALSGLPAAWKAGPTLSFPRNERELTMCTEMPWGAIVAGIFIVPSKLGATVDLAAYAPMLDQILAAGERAPRATEAIPSGDAAPLALTTRGGP
ncbi:MAG: hypothetical protein U1F43_28485 [Myxococcota bacterium]